MIEILLTIHLQICEIDRVNFGETQSQWNNEQERPPLFRIGVGRGFLGIIDHNGVVQGDVNGEVVAEVVGGQFTNDLDRRKTTIKAKAFIFASATSYLTCATVFGPNHVPTGFLSSVLSPINAICNGFQ